MLKINGREGSAIVYADALEPRAEEQIRQLCDQPLARGSRIRIMPDCHAGKGCTIGTTMTIAGKVVPNLVGVDIGCGMECARLEERRLEWQKLDKLIRTAIPSGFAVRQTPHRMAEEVDLTALRCAGKGGIRLDRAALSVGTLGGGNHFIEADRDDEGRLYLVIHSGSRRLGCEVADYYQEQGWRALCRLTDAEIGERIAAYKAAGREKELQGAVAAWKKEAKPAVPRELAYVEGELFDDYLHDMAIVQRFADCNRRAMLDVLVRGMKLHVADRFATVHNYIDIQAMILRKGAVSARAGERLLIPMNMRDGSLLCTGKGNEDWNGSAPHGAGRLMSRAAARESFTLSQYKKEMQGIYTTSVGRETLDECPMAYKPMESIMAQIGDTVTVDAVIRPLYNFKAGDE